MQRKQIIDTCWWFQLGQPRPTCLLLKLTTRNCKLVHLVANTGAQCCVSQDSLLYCAHESLLADAMQLLTRAHWTWYLILCSRQQRIVILVDSQALSCVRPWLASQRRRSSLLVMLISGVVTWGWPAKSALRAFMNAAAGQHQARLQDSLHQLPAAAGAE